MKLFWFVMKIVWLPARLIIKVLGLHPVSNDKLRPTLLGKLAPGKTPHDLKQYLRGKGFRRDPLEWVDEGEVLGLRKFDSFKYQYHIRVYHNGEVRGHHEVTPEYNYFLHLRGPDTIIGDLPEILKDWLIPG